MRKRFLLCVIALVVLAASVSHAQIKKRIMVVRSAPTFTLQLTMNYNQSYLEFNGTYNNDFHSEDFRKGYSLGADKGLGASLTSKISISGRGRLRLITSVDYNNFKTYLFGKNNQVADVGNSSINVLSLGLGLEHNFTPNYKFKLYLGAQATANLFWGKSTNWVDTGGGNYTYNIKIENSWRMGIAFFGGSEYMINEDIGISAGFKYNFANLFLKDSKQTADPNSANIPLRDASDANVKYAGYKNLNYISLMAGVNFYWGMTTKRYQIK